MEASPFPKIVSLLFLLTVISNIALGQDEKPASTPEQRAQRITSWMKSELKLSPDQEPVIQNINLKYAIQNESLKASGGGKLAKYKKYKSGQEAKEAELKQALTPEQFNLYLDKKDELQEKMKDEWRESRN